MATVFASSISAATLLMSVYGIAHDSFDSHPLLHIHLIGSVVKVAETYDVPQWPQWSISPTQLSRHHGPQDSRVGISALNWYECFDSLAHSHASVSH